MSLARCTGRLIWLALAVVLPAATMAGLTPASLVPICLGLIMVCVVVSMLDAELGIRRLRAVKVMTPEFLRITKNTGAKLPVTVENGPVRLALRMPRGIESGEKVIDVLLRRGAREALAAGP